MEGRHGREVVDTLSMLPSRLTSHEQGLAVGFDTERLEPGARAGTLDAAPSVWLEDGAVGRADQVLAIRREELVGPEVQRSPGVRTTVDIGVVAAGVVHDEAVHGPAVSLHPEDGCLAGLKRVRRAAP